MLLTPSSLTQFLDLKIELPSMEEEESDLVFGEFTEADIVRVMDELGGDNRSIEQIQLLDLDDLSEADL